MQCSNKQMMSGILMCAWARSCLGTWYYCQGSGVTNSQAVLRNRVVMDRHTRASLQTEHEP